MNPKINQDMLDCLPPWMSNTTRFALVRYGGGIVQMSGSIAGDTFARNRFGNYSRARTKPVNPRSSRQVGARVIMMFLAEQWRESPMTDAKRAAWETYADSVNWQNKLGETIKLTGYQHFIRSNSAILRIGGTFVDDGPLDLGLPAGDPVFQVSACSAAAQTFTCTFDDTMDWATEDDAYLAMQQGVPQNATRNFFGGPWRTCAFLSGVDPGGIASPALALPNIGYPLVEGQKIWWRARIIRADGRISTHFECDPVIAVA